MVLIKSNKKDRTSMRNDEHFQYVAELIELINRFGAEALQIETQFEELRKTHLLADNAFRNIAKSVKTEDVRLLDKRRDTALAGMNDKIRGAAKHFRQEVKDAARSLKIVMDAYKNIAKLPLHEQTSAVHNLMQELRGRFAPDVKTLGIIDWVDELENANNALALTMRDRREEAVAQKPEINMQTARKRLDDSINAITQRLNALALIEGEQGFTEFAAAINKLMADFKARLNQRLSRKN